MFNLPEQADEFRARAEKLLNALDSFKKYEENDRVWISVLTFDLISVLSHCVDGLKLFDEVVPHMRSSIFEMLEKRKNG